MSKPAIRPLWPSMTSFKEGDTVTFQKSRFVDGVDMKGRTFTVLEVESVHPEEIEYNPNTHDGGVGHHQLLKISDFDSWFSGAWFDPLLN